MLDGTKAMRKTYPIVIQANDPSGTADYSVYHSRYQGTEHRLLARRVSEGEVQDLLSERDYAKFQEGKGDFRVSGQRLAEVLQVLV